MDPILLSVLRFLILPSCGATESLLTAINTLENSYRGKKKLFYVIIRVEAKVSPEAYSQPLCVIREANLLPGRFECTLSKENLFLHFKRMR